CSCTERGSVPARLGTHVSAPSKPLSGALRIRYAWARGSANDTTPSRPVISFMTLDDVGVRDRHSLTSIAVISMPGSASASWSTVRTCTVTGVTLACASVTNRKTEIIPHGMPFVQSPSRSISWKLEAGSRKLAAGSWKLEAANLRVHAQTTFDCRSGGSCI